jgi:hypothetical protein
LEKINVSWFLQLQSHIDKIQDPKEKNSQIRNNYGGCPFIKASYEVAQDDTIAIEIINSNKMRFLDLILDILQDVSLPNHILTKKELANSLSLLMEGTTVIASFQKNKAIIVDAKTIVKRLLRFTN